MDAVSPFFATTRLLNEIRSVRARREHSQPETHAKSDAREEAAPQKPRRTPK
jgi:hypothetical protein